MQSEDPSPDKTEVPPFRPVKDKTLIYSERKGLDRLFEL